jgi:hypothetical protein
MRKRRNAYKFRISLAPQTNVTVSRANEFSASTKRQQHVYDAEHYFITSTHLQNISPQLAATQEQDSLLGLVVLLDLVGYNQWKFGNSIDDMTYNVKQK